MSLRAVIWVSGTKLLGQLLSHQPLYSGYIGTSHGARVYSGQTVFLVYSCACTQTSWNTLVSMTLVVW